MKLQEGETIIHELRPEPNILVIWFFAKCLPTASVIALVCAGLAALLPALLGALTDDCTQPAWLAGAIAGAATWVVALSLAVVYCRCLWKTYTYYVTNQRCVWHGGILRRVERSVPYHKVTDVEMSQNIIERALGISSLNIFTPGTGSVTTSTLGKSGAEISFVGLKDNETPADTINEILKKFRATGE